MKKAIRIQSILDMVYLCLNIIGGIVLIPYYLKFISINLYGFWLATSGIIVLFDALDFGISSIFTERISKLYSTEKFKTLTDYFFSGLFLFITLSFLILFVGLIFSLFLDTFFDLDSFREVIINCFKISLLTSCLKLINAGFINFGSSLFKPLYFSLTKIISLIISLIFVIKLLNLDFGLYSLAIGYLVQQILGFFFFFFISIRLIKKLNPTPKWAIKFDVLKDYLFSMKYLFFARSAESAIKNIEPVIIASTLGPNFTAIYVFGKKISDLIYQFVNIFSGASFSSLINIQQKIKSGDKDVRIDNINKFIFYISIILLGFYIAINNNFLHIWVGEEFKISSNLVPLFGLASLLMIWIQFRTVFYFSKNIFKYVSKVLFFEAIFRLGLLFLLINNFGMFGGPIAIILSSSSAILFLEKKISIDFNSAAIFFYIFSTSTILGKINFVDIPIYNIFIKCTIVFILSSLLLLNRNFRENIIRLKDYILH